MRDITASNQIFKSESTVNDSERFASCIVVGSVVNFLLFMAVITPRSDSENVPRTSLNLARPSDVNEEFDFDVAEPQVTTARVLARSGMSLKDIATNEQFFDDNGHPSYSITGAFENGSGDIPASAIRFAQDITCAHIRGIRASKPSEHRNPGACTAASARGGDAISCNAACGSDNVPTHGRPSVTLAATMAVNVLDAGIRDLDTLCNSL